MQFSKFLFVVESASWSCLVKAAPRQPGKLAWHRQGPDYWPLYFKRKRKNVLHSFKASGSIPIKNGFNSIGLQVGGRCCVGSSHQPPRFAFAAPGRVTVVILASSGSNGMLLRVIPSHESQRRPANASIGPAASQQIDSLSDSSSRSLRHAVAFQAQTGLRWPLAGHRE